MIPDYHWHTARCGHASGSMSEYVMEAQRQGLIEVGFADHIPMYWLPEGRRDSGLAMAGEEFPFYVQRVLALRETTPVLEIRLGVEADFIPGSEGDLKSILSAYPFDYVIGSVHYIDGWGYDNPDLMHEYEKRNLDELYALYFEQLCAAARSGLFDIIAHPDLIKKFGHRLAKQPLDLYRKAALAFAEAGVCVELNTAGLRMPAAEIYPAREFLAQCRKKGVPVTTGSDAHQPEQVGWGFKLALELLKDAGYSEVALFRERNRTFTRI